nr:uncharacterized protein LOC112019631 [Quercus suber]POF16417.1 glutathione s-transferase gst-6.0 [Quercus suber]
MKECDSRQPTVSQQAVFTTDTVSMQASDSRHDTEARGLTLYRKDGACSIAAHMLLRELDLPFRDAPMEAGPGGYEPADKNMSRDDFLRLNPAGMVPTLVVNGATVITELSAVLTYISSLAPERGMTGATPLETARVLEWLSWLSVTLNEYGFAGYWRPSRMVGLDAATEVQDAVRAHGKSIILQGFARIEEKIADGNHAIGSHLTVVDMMLHTFWRWGVMASFDMNLYPKFRRIVLSLEKLESVKATLAVEGIALLFDAS